VASRERQGLATPLAICAALGLALLGGSLASGSSSVDSSPREAARRVAPVPVIARRVEAIRGLKFTSIPKPKVVDGGEARREGLADVDKSYPEARRRADEELYKLLRLLAPGDDLRRIAASVFEGQIAGYYDPRSGAMRIVESDAPADPVGAETTLAHELVHALEDQRFELRVDDLDGSGDASLAYAALAEGTATALMEEYQRRHFKPSEALGSALAAGLAVPSTEGIPAFLVNQLIFPYLGGARFVGELYATGGDTWRLVDLAFRTRPPESTEQVMHPEKWLRVEQPVRVSVAGIGALLGPSYRRVAADTFGEWQTREWLRRGAGDADQAASGWGGDRYELWRRGPLSGCSAPCVARDVLVMRWAWDSGRDAGEFQAALEDAVEEGLEARRSGPGLWSLRGGAVAVDATEGRTVTLALAPSPALARRVARLGG
jgi:hypothetical protein